MLNYESSGIEMTRVVELFGQFKDEMGQKKNAHLKLAGPSERFYGRILKCDPKPQYPTDLEEILRESQTDKEKLRDMLFLFYDFYEKRTGVSVETDLAEKTIIDDVTQRRLAIIQYLQNHKCRTRDISEQFVLSDRTTTKDLAALEDGIHILDTEIKIDLDRDKWNKSMAFSSHPLVLNLTMTEVVAMTIGLMDAAEKELLYAPQFRKVAKDIYRGLTRYGQGQLARLIDIQKLSDEFRDEIEEYEHQISTDLLTMWKSGCEGTLQIRSDGIDHSYVDAHVIGYEDGIIKILTRENKEVEFPVADVYDCSYHLEREFE